MLFHTDSLFSNHLNCSYFIEKSFLKKCVEKRWNVMKICKKCNEMSAHFLHNFSEFLPKRFIKLIILSRKSIRNQWLRHQRAGFESQSALFFEKSVIFSAFLAMFQRISAHFSATLLKSFVVKFSKKERISYMIFFDPGKNRRH